MSAGQLLIVGESLIDVVHRVDGTVDASPGGSPANVALTLGRLGHRPQFMTWVGPDAAGAEVLAWLAGSSVDVVPGSDGAQRTSSATATLAADGGAQYVFDIDWQLPELPGETQVEHVHLGSIGAVIEPGFGDVVALIERLRPVATVSYDPNIRPDVMEAVDVTRAKVERLVALSDVVKVSDEDLEWLEPGTPPEDLARRWAESGPSLVVMTRGGAGAIAFHPGGRALVEGVLVDVVDTVGAGDTFMGALIDGLLSAGCLGQGARDALATIDDAVLDAVLRRCARAAAVTVSRAGANPPTLAELDGA